MTDEAVQMMVISIHAPREGSDPRFFHCRGQQFLFQSTLPVRGATLSSFPGHSGHRISIHAPREGSDYPRRKQDAQRRISIHAPREGSDPRASGIPPL